MQSVRSSHAAPGGSSIAPHLAAPLYRCPRQAERTLLPVFYSWPEMCIRSARINYRAGEWTRPVTGRWAAGACIRRHTVLESTDSDLERVLFSLPTRISKQVEQRKLQGGKSSLAETNTRRRRFRFSPSSSETTTRDDFSRRFLSSRRVTCTGSTIVR